jgi:hypothetical protein
MLRDRNPLSDEQRGIDGTLAGVRNRTIERIDAGTDKRFVRRVEQGQFKESTEVGRSLATDRRKHSKTVVPGSHGDLGDQKKR